jgi:hypothetical protein
MLIRQNKINFYRQQDVAKFSADLLADITSPKNGDIIQI